MSRDFDRWVLDGDQVIMSIDTMPHAAYEAIEEVRRFTVSDPDALLQLVEFSKEIGRWEEKRRIQGLVQ